MGMVDVVITVTSKKVGTWLIAPYNRAEGLEYGLGYETRYQVPIYEIIVGKAIASPVFKAVRFGLVRNNKQPPPEQRWCDAGLADAQTTRPTWVPTYMPHSFEGSRPGAWQLYPGKGWLIHEGTQNTTDFVGGSLGCIEIVGPSEWNRFLNTIEGQAGTDCATVGRKKMLQVIIQQAERPMAVLIK